MVVQNFKTKLANFSKSASFPYLVMTLVFAIVCVLALRHNNTTMIKLRNEVYRADRNNGDVEGALDNLREYVYGHMNTDLSAGNSIKPPIQLKYTYERLAAQSQKDANNSELYTAAENYCQEQIPASVSISGRGRISCVTEYVLSHGGKEGKTVPPALYEFDFESPSWSSDLAGWSLLATLASALLAVGTFIRSLLAKKDYRKYIKG